MRGPRPNPFHLPYEEWMDEGKCRSLDSRIFFPPDGHFLLPREAIEVCNFCPVQLDCLTYALKNNIDDGVWGGTTRNDRRRIRRRSRVRLAHTSPLPPELRYG